MTTDLNNIPTVDHDDADNIIVDVLDGYAENRGLDIDGARDAVSLGEDIQRIEATLRALLQRSALLDTLLAERDASSLREVAARVRDQLADVLTQEDLSEAEPEPAPETKYQRPDWLPEGWRVKWSGYDYRVTDVKVGDIVTALEHNDKTPHSGKVASVSDNGRSVRMEKYPCPVGYLSKGLGGNEQGWTYYILERDWITWEGGACPVEPTTRVERELRNGNKRQENAGDLRWSHLDISSDIVKYRIID